LLATALAVFCAVVATEPHADHSDVLTEDIVGTVSVSVYPVDWVDGIGAGAVEDWDEP
jgi:hypothetical protein